MTALRFRQALADVDRFYHDTARQYGQHPASEKTQEDTSHMPGLQERDSTQTHTQTDRQRLTETDRQRQRKRQRKRDSQRDTDRDRQTER